MENNRKKNKAISLEAKLNAIQEIKNGKSQTEIANELGVHKATVNLWVKNKNVLKEWCDGSKNIAQNLKNKRKTQPKHGMVDEAVWMWYQEHRAAGSPPNGNVIKTQALQIAKSLDNETTFRASDGWLAKWKARHGIRKISSNEEEVPADDLMASDEVQKSFSDRIGQEDLTPEQVFSCGECGLGYNEIPDVLLNVESEENVARFKAKKQRVSLMACSNASGSLKLPLVFISGSKSPRNIKNLTSLRVIFKNKKSTRMTAQLFEEWFREDFVPQVSEFLHSKHLPIKAILFVGNRAPHNQNLKVGDVRIEFLPGDSSSMFLPMNQGCLQDLRSLYRMFLLDFLSKKLSSGDGVVTTLDSITIREAMFWISNAWKAVTQTTIINSWRLVWPEIVDILKDILIENQFATDRLNEVQSEDFMNLLLQNLKSRANYDDNDLQQVNEWIYSDEPLPMHNNSTEDEINEDFELNQNVIDTDPTLEIQDRVNFVALKNNLESLIEHCKNNPYYTSQHLEALKDIKVNMDFEFILHPFNVN